jgi:cellulose synthase/poly-beta-1,6-N-acetylglucosamine synthase-like glycosyltransferase
MSVTSLVVYVDSGSSDGSVELARQFGATVLELDLSIPFCAARARNAGFARLRELGDEVEFVQFVDGDCEIVPGWLNSARDELTSHPAVAVVCGRLRELHPEASIYNRLCDLEWDRHPGDAEHCGGIFMIDAAKFEAIDGFDSGIPAGEEPELCQRLRSRGWRVVRLPDEMGWHDAGMTRFAQWWRRQIRGGYSGLDVHRRFGIDGHSPFGRQIRSTRLWTVAWPALVILAASGGWVAGGFWVAALLSLGIVLLLPLQIFRVAYRTSKRDYPICTALAHGVFTMLAKWAQLWGHCRYLCDRRMSNTIQLIDYKKISAAPLMGHRAGL